MENLCVASIGVLRVWDFCTPETAAETLERAKAYHEERMESLGRIIAEHPEENFSWARDALAEEKATEYAVMPYDSYLTVEREKRLSSGLTKTNKEDYDYAFEVLPPLYYCKEGTVTQFCMSEFDRGVYTTQYAHDARTDTYYCKTVDAYDPSTWISEILYPTA